jgi:hypothetical protein
MRKRRYDGDDGDTIIPSKQSVSTLSQHLWQSTFSLQRVTSFATGSASFVTGSASSATGSECTPNAQVESLEISGF